MIRKALSHGVSSIGIEPFEHFHVFCSDRLPDARRRESINEEPFAQRRIRETNRHGEQQILPVQVSPGRILATGTRMAEATATVSFEHLISRDPLKYVERAIRVNTFTSAS